jgi:hypothetical protein
MRTSKTVGAVSLALALLAATAPVMAGPVQFKVGDSLLERLVHKDIKDEVVADVFQFHLASSQKLSGDLVTAGQASGPVILKSKLDITKVYLKSASNPALAPIDLIGVDADLGVEVWTLSGALLTAGDWELHVEGKGGLKSTSKQANSYAVQLTGVNAVPEPQTLALSLLALCGLVVVKRLRKA